MAIRTPSGKTLPGNLAIIPSEQSCFFMPFISMHFHICILPKFVLEIALCLLMKTKQSTDHVRLSSKQQVNFNSQLLCFVPFMVFGWHSRRIYSLCWKTVIVARFMVIIFRTSMTSLIRYWQMSYQLHSRKDTSKNLWRRLSKHFKSN